MKYLSFAALLLSVFLFTPAAPRAFDWRGMNLVLRRNGQYAPILSYLRSLNANAVSLVISCVQSRVDVDCSGAPTDVEIQTAIQESHRVGLLVILKPHIETSEFSWRGEIDFANDDLRQFFLRYEEMILRLADLRPDALVVGTELKNLSRHEMYWRRTIWNLRQRYFGKVFYAANWDEAASVRWWDAVDAIGIDAYYPLKANAATVPELNDAWLPYMRELRGLAEQYKKPVIFLEVGYQSRLDSYLTPWQRDPAIPSTESQRIAYQSVFETFNRLPWWRGAMWWDAGKIWYAGIPFFDWETGRYNSWDVGFTPRGKPAEGILQKYWKSEAQP